MLRDKGNICMRRGKFHDLLGRPYLGGGGGWVEGLIYFEKNVYSVYPGNAYR